MIFHIIILFNPPGERQWKDQAKYYRKQRCSHNNNIRRSSKANSEVDEGSLVFQIYSG